MKINFKRNFKLVDNGDLTQNLHSLCYQNNILISEADLGNVEDILVQLKKQKEIIDTLKKYLILNIELIKEQPSNDELTDNFILRRFKSLLSILEDKEVSE